LQGARTECDGEKQAVIIIRKYIKDGQITAEEEIILKTQLLDSLKIISIGIPFAVLPGASVLIPCHGNENSISSPIFNINFAQRRK